ncbi:helix-turn-helix domain-containing protein [Paenibacillus polymyxa]|uniref:helix-turn-helix domain-containing protein n=1 Tax=Paenibacillus polymyxa TaxID=1406 RepID=UPI001C9D862D|nr:helix-turn-helix transcriptional regulator [Paenibacillus polymyxa]MBY7740095.1 helix-turn-helix domain-containing protein [Paenibacillus polymyxa]UMR33720.1 helix-turn-helix domain-containing protein [Paenibacillus polymyxa]
MASYPNRIREIRKSQKKSGVQVAEFLGITPQFLYNIEKGSRTLNTEVASKLAEYFDVTVDYLLGRTEAEKDDRQYPEWATSKDIRDFKTILEEDAPVMFDGVPISEDDKEKIKRVMEAMFWDAKKNKKD